MSSCLWRVLALIALLCLFACADRVHVLRVDPAFTLTERAQLRDAAEKWNAVSNHHITVLDEPCDGDEECIAKRHTRPVLGTCRRSAEFITIDPSVQGDLFTHVALHEFGHLIGIINHTETGVMSASVETPTEITPVDLAACRAVESCD